MSVSRRRPSGADILSDRRFLPVLSVVAILVVICLIGWFQSAPPETAKALPPDPFTDPAAGMAHIRKLAGQYGSDFDRLSADDRLMLNAIASGHGRELLAKTAREVKAAPSGSATAPGR